MDIVRTPDERFADLPGLPVRASLRRGGRRRRPVARALPRRGTGRRGGGPAAARGAVVELPLPHDGPGARRCRLRAVAIDLVGFGRSDKPARREDYTYQCARGLDLVGDRGHRTDPTSRWCARTGADSSGCGSWASIPTASPGWWPRTRCCRRAITSPARRSWPGSGTARRRRTSASARSCRARACRYLPDEVIAAYDAPFPDDSYKAGARQFPMLVPISPDDPAAPANRAAWEQLRRFDRPFLCAFSDSDPDHPRSRRGDAETHPRRRRATPS